MSGSSSPSSFTNIAQAIGLTELRATYPTLTGAGVIVAQIEANLNTSGTGAPEFEPNPDINTHATITFTDGTLSTTAYNDGTIGAASSHADTVGEYFYGTAIDSGGAPEGVAPGVTTIDNYYADSFSISGTTASFPAKVVNLSFDYTTPTGGNDLFDQLANQFNVVVVAAAGNSDSVTSPASAYNAIAVSSSTTLLATGPAADGADKPDISAPGVATSYTAPIVSGAATLLVQAGTNGLAGWSATEKFDAVDFRSIKAILLNSATKPADYFTNQYAPTSTQPLSAEYGSGVVNIDAAVTALYAGEEASEYSQQIAASSAIFTSLAGDPTLAENGWSLGTLSNTITPSLHSIFGPTAQEDVHGYAITIAAGTTFVATLTWAATNNDAIDNLGLYAYNQTTGTLLDSSTATLSSVQQIYLTSATSEVIDLFAVLPDSGLSNNSDIYALAYGDPVAPLCYFAGTRITTPHGETPVEALQAGDLVETANGPKPVRWIGRSEVAMGFANRLRACPIRICAGALGDDLPRRDLVVSPGHALFLDGLLVQASALVNGSSIIRETNPPAHFTYYHVELASHELLLAEGAWAESFVDNVNRMNFHNWDARNAPAEPIAELHYPRVKAARQLPSILRARFLGAETA
jgi:Hint domain/Subtilase family